jgi:integrase
MAHIDDRWEKVVDGQRVRTDRYGRGSRWYARWTDPDGKERARAVARRADADRFLATVTVDVMQGSYVDPHAGKITIADFATRWLASQTSDPSTREAMASRFKVHILPTLGHLEVRSVRPSAVQAWLGDLQDRVAPTYAKVMLANVSAMFGAAVEDGLLTRNPCAARSVRAPRVPQHRVQPWTAEQVRAVIAGHPVRYRAIPVVGAGCGLRQGEIFGLRLQDVDFLRRRLLVEQQVKQLHGRCVIAPPKGGKRRTVPMPDAVGEALAEHIRQFPPSDEHGGLLFTSREHKPLNRNYFNPYVWKLALVRAGIEPDRAHGMHALRHYYASVLLDAGESIKAVAEYLGHADPGFTLRVYTHLLPTSEDGARRAIDQVLGAVSDGPQTDQEAL